MVVSYDAPLIRPDHPAFNLGKMLIKGPRGYVVELSGVYSVPLA
jgi:hypothetical protein